MVVIGSDIKTIAYIRSEAEFRRAKIRGSWDSFLSRLTGCRTHLLSFNAVVTRPDAALMIDRGLQDVPIKEIVGSVGRDQEYTRHFLPRLGGENGKERWRKIYTLVSTGCGLPPVELYRVGRDYFVKDGHHRVSVAKYLDWETIQADVIEIPVEIPELVATTPAAGDRCSLS